MVLTTDCNAVLQAEFNMVEGTSTSAVQEELKEFLKKRGVRQDDI